MPSMGRKSSAKENRPGPDGSRAAGEKKKGPGALVLVALMVLALGAGAYMIWGGGQGDASASANAAQAKNGKPDPAEMAKNEAFARKMAALGPHKQASYPPIPFAGIRAAAAGEDRQRRIHVRRRAPRSR